MLSRFQKRIFLNLLDENEKNLLIKRILKSPLSLSQNLTVKLFENRITELREDLDSIKMFVAGITRADKLSSYKLAEYYPHIFSLNQFIQSSFRARQGKVLEEIIKHILKEYIKCDIIPNNNNETIQILEKTTKSKLDNLDVDALGIKNDRILIFQLRSRDDTGGTTAKESLVDMLRQILRKNKFPANHIHYLIGVWDKRTSQQKNSTISKIIYSLSDFIDNIDDLKTKIQKSYNISEKITIQLAYGKEEIIKAFCEWGSINDNKILNSIDETIDLIENWDDLWIAYTITSLEIEINILKSFSNIEVLNQKISNLNFSITSENYNRLCKQIDNLTLQILPMWKENSLPFASISDNAHYIRDLIFLKTIYEKTKNER